MRDWEQNEVGVNIPTYSIDMETNESFVTLHVRGDQHIGVRGIDIEQMTEVYLREQEQHRGHMIVLDTGDGIENALKSSIGHNYDVDIADPAEQITLFKQMVDICDRDLYGPTYNTMKKITRKNTKHCRHVGVIGNHEYRTRKSSGIWLNNDMYSGTGILDAGIRAILKINITNKKLKMKRTYRVHLSHRLTNSGGVSVPTLYKNFQKLKSDIDCDVYVCGHYHMRYVESDIKYTPEGDKKKVMFVCNPSPVGQIEYAAWSMYSPIESAYYSNVYLPLEPNLNCWSKK